MPLPRGTAKEGHINEGLRGSMPIVGEIQGRSEDLSAYAKDALPKNGCRHAHPWHSFFGNGVHKVWCADCGAEATTPSAKDYPRA